MIELETLSDIVGYLKTITICLSLIAGSVIVTGGHIIAYTWRQSKEK